MKMTVTEIDSEFGDTFHYETDNVPNAGDVILHKETEYVVQSVAVSSNRQTSGGPVFHLAVFRKES